MTNLKIKSHLHPEINKISQNVIFDNCNINSNILLLLNEYLDDIITFYNTADDYILGDIPLIRYRSLIVKIKERKLESKIELKKSWEKENNSDYSLWISKIIKELNLIKYKKK